MVKYVTISGKKGCGKDTAAEYLKQSMQEFGYTSEIFPFAKLLKQTVSTLLGIPLDLMYTEEGKNTLTKVKWDGFDINIRLKYSNEFSKPPMIHTPLDRRGFMTVRDVLQVIGTDIFRERVYADIWAEAPFKQDWSGVDVVIIPDCRFPNEVKATSENNGIVLRITRDTGYEDNHVSETALDGFYFENTYDNNGSLQDLYNYLYFFTELVLNNLRHE